MAVEGPSLNSGAIVIPDPSMSVDFSPTADRLEIVSEAAASPERS